ncbi:MAG: nif-specific transcriptional activator NifA [Sulfurimicrobium sp.]|nr:nif-specific transcriptional activator NifA [Sulfurimicrobium sp.]MDP2961509.1 nif-specific transcriptional activator NifA [Sulfurimicrobium sp.]
MPQDRSNVELVTIYEISKVLSSSLDLQKTLQGVLNLLSTHLHMRRGMLSLQQEDGELQVVAATGLSQEEIERGRFFVGEGVIGRIMQNCMPAVIPSVADEPLFLNRTGVRKLHDEDVAFIGVPVKLGRRCIGVLSVDRECNPERGFQQDVRFLSMVSNLIGQTVRLHQNVAQERTQLMQEKSRLQKELQGKYSLDNVIGVSKRMQQVFADVHQAAPGKATILIRGESGTGKEAIAHAIHVLSPRRDGPFVKLNCAALPETLLESELFGHEKGSFTGATSERKGRFEQAHGGTLFLDEIGDISPGFQAKLLRVLQEREFERVGGNRTIKVNVRLVTATNRNLEEMVSKGEFRADLYFRINVVSIFLPPLRERRDDIPPLLEHFLEKFNQENKRKLAISEDAMESIVNCGWPGNVRELENCVERMATMTRGNLIRRADLLCQKGLCFSSALRNYGATHPSIPILAEAEHQTEMPTRAAATEPPVPHDETEPLAERERLMWAMEKSGWVQAKAARLLDLTPRQMGYALKKYDIDIKRF